MTGDIRMIQYFKIISLLPGYCLLHINQQEVIIDTEIISVLIAYRLDCQYFLFDELCLQAELQADHDALDGQTRGVLIAGETCG